MAQRRIQRGRQLTALPAGTKSMGRSSQTSAPLPRAGENPDAGPGRLRAAPGLVPVAAAGARMDPASRPRRAAGAHLPGAVGRYQGGGAEMSPQARRDAVIFKI